MKTKLKNKFRSILKLCKYLPRFKNRDELHLKNNCKILLVSEWKTIGDCVKVSVITSELKRLYPNSWIHVIARSEAVNVWKLFKNTVDLVQEQGGKTFWERTLNFVRIVKSIIGSKYDISIACGKSTAFGFALMCRSAIVTGDTDSNTGKMMFSDKLAKFEISKSSPITERYLCALARIGLPVNLKTKPMLVAPRINIDAAIIDLDEKYAVVCPLGSGSFDGLAREIDISLFSKIVKVLNEKYEKVYVIGSSAQRDYIGKKYSGIKFCNIAGKISLAELTVVLSKAQKFFTTDTGPMHLADALDVPSVAVIRHGQYDEYRPLSSKFDNFIVKVASDNGITDKMVDLPALLSKL
ncbi:MAG: glycosyltransferase family 9 protein [Negativicutes bacterium]|jgi:heptosyltransferase-2